MQGYGILAGRRGKNENLLWHYASHTVRVLASFAQCNRFAVKKTDNNIEVRRVIAVLERPLTSMETFMYAFVIGSYLSLCVVIVVFVFVKKGEIKVI
jgi:hypothetical protein